MTTPIALSSRALFEQVAPELDGAARSWLEAQLADTALLTDPVRRRVAFAQVARKLGALDVVQSARPEHAIDRARGTLLRAVLEQTAASEHEAIVRELYRTGEQGEQRSVLRTLPKLPEPERFTPLAIEACRTNSLLVFAAIAAENRFPTDYFPEHNFNQLVLKAIFLGLSVARIERLSSRINDELRRMLREYERERLAAGRSVPHDVPLLLGLPSP